MPTYLQDSVGISGGSTLIGGTAASETLSLISTSNATKGKIYLGDTSSASSSAYDEVNNALLIGRKFSLPINSGSGKMFNGSIPKAEFLTGLSAGAYDECVVIRHELVDSTAVTRRVGLLLKIASEIDTNESSKSGGVILESDSTYGNQPKLSLITNYTERLTILIDGKIGINTLYPSYQLDINGTARTGALTTTTIAASGMLSANAGLTLTVGSDATGDMYYRNSSGQLARVGIGTSGQVLTIVSGLPTWGIGGSGGGTGLIGATTPYSGGIGGNTFLGIDTGFVNTTGTFNVFIGIGAGYQNTTGSGNVFIGEGAGSDNTTGYANIHIGSDGCAVTTGVGNIMIGNFAGYSTTVESRNIAIGSAADCSAGASNSTAIGQYASAAISNAMVLGSEDPTYAVNVGIGISTPLYKLDVNGTTRAKGLILDQSGAGAGDIYYRDSSGAFHRLAIGSSGQVLKVVGGLPAWV